MTLCAPLLPSVVAVLLALAGAAAAVAGVAMMRRALGQGSALDLLRGIRVLILGVVTGLAALACASGNTGFLVIGLLILAEELYEIGTLAAIVRWGDRPA